MNKLWIGLNCWLEEVANSVVKHESRESEKGFLRIGMRVPSKSFIAQPV